MNKPVVKSKGGHRQIHRQKIVSTCCERQIYVTENMRRKCVCQIVHVLQCSVPSNLGEVACVNICSDHRKLANILLHRTTVRTFSFTENWRTLPFIGQLVITCFELDTRQMIKISGLDLLQLLGIL